MSTNKDVLNNAEYYGHSLVELLDSEVISVEEVRQLLGLEDGRSSRCCCRDC